MEIKTTSEIEEFVNKNKNKFYDEKADWTHFGDKTMNKKWVAVDDLKELIRRNKMDDDELEWNNVHSDWNKSLLIIESSLSKSTEQSSKSNKCFTATPEASPKSCPTEFKPFCQRCWSGGQIKKDCPICHGTGKTS